ELPKYLTETKWARCAVAQGKTPDGFPVFQSHWNPHVQIVSPPGIGSFFASVEYAHGGISPQECVVPDMIVERGTEVTRARITGVSWRGMRCRVTVDTNASGVNVDLRLHPRKSDTSIVVSAKAVDKNGEVSLAVVDDRHEGAASVVVLLDSAENILDQKPTQVGEN
ncbi:MAG: BREX-1 system phosphatase PglZ type B, partial [Candidatus Hydrogenedentes bacterium]|nr:BREX-1 system phosphatase PglZ type B [Candidatus Hydrogenedentota bacterium]